MDPGFDFSVSRRREGDLTVVLPVGEVDLATVEPLRTEALAALGEAPHVAVDLRGVSFMDSSGLRLVVELQREAERRSSRLAFVRGPEPVAQLFELAGLTGHVRLVGDLDEARPGGGGDG